MIAIAAADKNWAIGRNGGLLASIRDDMEFFRNTTTGSVVVMGRKTLESFPGGRPLRDRINIVLTGNKAFEAKDVTAVHSVDELLLEIKKYNPDRVFCIGGGEVYKLLLPYCDTALITRIDYAYDADTYFPNLDEDPEWEITEESEEHTSFDLAFKFVTYRRKK